MGWGVIALAMTLIAGGPAAAQSKQLDTKAVTTKAEAIVKYLAAGNFAAVEPLTAPDSLELRPASALVEAWKYATDGEGPIRRIVGTKVLPNCSYPFAHVTVAFAKENVLAVLSFNAKGLLDTLNAVPCGAASDCMP